MINSPLKWAGGKSKIVLKVKAIWDKELTTDISLRYVDLFCGSCIIPLNLKAEEVLVNDINKHLIDFWLWVENNGIIKEFQFENNMDYYNTIKESFNSNPTPEKFYYLNRTCYNGLYRVNSSGKFNVPFGKHKTVNYLIDFSAYKEIIQNWNFSSTDFKDISLYHRDFVFADPPYDDGFVGYAVHKFSWDDQVALATKLSKHSGCAITTNKATDRIIELYSDLGFNIEFIDMPRRISCTGDRTPVKEIFATRNIQVSELF